MSVHFQSGDYTLLHGDCIDMMRTLPDESIDAVVTDPPYGIRFMGEAWDGADIEAIATRGRATSPMPDGVGGPRGGYRSSAAEAGRYNQTGAANRAFQAWCEDWATEALRVLKPGGHLIASGSPRTTHRLAAGIEDAGFEIRDSIAWLFGSGFPKSLDVAKAIDKAAGATRKIIGACRGNVGMPGGNYASGGASGQVPVTATATAAAEAWEGWGTALKPAFEPIVVARKPTIGTVATNVLAHGTGALNVDATRIPATDSQLAEKYASVAGTGARVNRVFGTDTRDRVDAPHSGGRWPTNVVLDDTQAAALDEQTGVSESRPGQPRSRMTPPATANGWGMTHTGSEYADAGGASRFFPTFRYEAKAPTSERPVVDGVAHPTVKPLDLMRWLVRLVTPPGGTVLEPFAGSGTTVEACIREGFACIAIEREAAYLPLILARIQKDQQQSLLGDWDGAA